MYRGGEMNTGFYYYSDKENEYILFVMDEGNPYEAWYTVTTDELSCMTMLPSGIGICQFESAIPISGQSAHTLLQSWCDNKLDKLNAEYEVSKKRLEEKWDWCEKTFDKGRRFQHIHLR